MNFASAYDQGFLRVAALTLPVTPARPQANAEAVLNTAHELSGQGVGVAVYPELGLSGYALDDILLTDSLLDDVDRALTRLVEHSTELVPVLVVGAPLPWRHRIYNCAVVIHRGRILGVAPKSYLPNYREFYEKRHFAPGDDIAGEITVARQRVPFGPDLLFRATDLPGMVLHVEICEDMWVPIPPSAEAALAGATVLANLSGSPITVARADERKLLARAASARCAAAYVYAAAGQGESSTDLSWDGQTFVYENGELLGESERFPDGPRSTVVDVDLDALTAERRRQGSYDDNRRTHAERTNRFRTVEFTLEPPRTDLGLRRKISRFPFVPDAADRLAVDCYEAYHIQVSGLMQRLRAIGSPTAVIGVSGGLDSTHALIVCARAMDLLGRPRSDILAYTMPGFATSAQTRHNAEELCRGLGVSFEEIDIRPTARQMLADMHHPFARGEEVYDVTFENVQAGVRYDYLFRLANAHRGIVVGTGDLSELALGWCTYGVGDQMSHYAVNTGVPKTLIQHLIRWVIDSEEFGDDVTQVLGSVLNTEISPELIPAGKDGRVQSTEDSIGPYALHDFTLYYLLRRGYTPHKIAFLARHAWSDARQGEWPPGFPETDRIAYDLATIRHWLQVFVRRFAANQFKRSALPNGPKVMAGGSLSPRGDWRMPSDMSPYLWTSDIDEHIPAS
ncbi:NAD+ synthase (glutamine-hydrolysing) [Austwickia chelonae]|uniref:Glutamine-dependent NAD(+) synthetase n=1 Tax=Austwickia chelonae NBRC 105200 TaxID=1184607 RepID=K6VMJ7_9MICO|nr:NAD(+) synthase [Austwickia chelonae]GAB77954.1 glutamine-dependent NAD(+) synthetase [Austwickia chelonae NBRC 105200]SEV92983.1 NAD+ synthase (glutamine-hydrolysing) [Austwickia chelonae]